MNQVLPVLLAEVASGEAREVSLVPIVLLFTLGPAAVLVLTRLISATHLALGFGATTAMWAIGYVSMMAPGFWIGEALFVATLAVPVAAGALARRAGATPVKVGLVCAFANLLVLGAFQS